jgi:transcriptional regulator with XRE-family HTH domain
MVASLKAQGVEQKNIAKGLGLSPEELEKFTVARLRDTVTIAKETIVREETNRAISLKARQWSTEKIAAELGISTGTVALRLKGYENSKKKSLKETASAIRDDVDKHGIVDIGKGVNFGMQISPERFRAAISILEDEGYEKYNLRQPQPGSQNLTNQLVLVPKGTGFGGAAKMVDKVYTPVKWTENEGKTYLGIHPPLSISSKRLKIVHAEEGGSDQDGFIYVRAGKKDLSMGNNRYSQVRIMIDGTHFIKGIAIVKDDMPPGPDIIFHTNKSRDKALTEVLKPLKTVKDKHGKETIDEANPFGSALKRQIISVDKDGNEKVTSALNILREEGDWDTWSNSLPSQMLAKQPQPFIRSQLAETQKQTKAEIAKLNSIENPVLKRKLLEKLADKIDSDAVDLKAAAMPRQLTQVIIPIPKLGKHEVYAPRFETGEKVVLIRYPHGGRFEIPEVTVNNNNRTAKKLLGNAPDAIGMHPAVAKRLSGADFDGDAVSVIPNAAGKIRGAASLGRAGYDFEKGLSNFEPQRQYGGFVQDKNPDGSGKVDKNGTPLGNFKLMRNTGQEMGMITNLVTDMSIQGARPDHIVRAVKHSMVVIDAEKHDLDYRRSAQDQGIQQLKKVYQSGTNAAGKDKFGGASTLLSLATAKERIEARKPRLAQHGGPIDPLTGERKFEPKGLTRNKFDKKTGKYTDEVVVKTEEVKRLALTSDAHTLVKQNAPVELIYADHANAMKALANSTRLAAHAIRPPKVNAAAKLVYKPEVDNLVRQLREAQAKAPLDRQAQRIANANIKMRLQDDPTLRYDADRRNKVERQAKKAARSSLGLKKYEMDITDREWDAIQAGAVTANIFRGILDGNHVSDKRLFELALPRTNTVMSAPVMSRVKAMLAAGMTNADIARQLGVSPSTVRAAFTKKDDD